MTCSFPGCSLEATARGLCPGHYQQKHRGRPLAELKTPKTPRLVPLATRVLPETRDTLRKRAAHAGLTLYEWMRRHAESLARKQ